MSVYAQIEYELTEALLSLGRSDFWSRSQIAETWGKKALTSRDITILEGLVERGIVEKTIRLSRRGAINVMHYRLAPGFKPMRAPEGVSNAQG